MRVALAPALRGFERQLAVFSAELPAVLGPWLSPLSRIVGPMRVPQSRATGDPDGSGGLTRRGTYDRLLVSEWLFALEEPDEFLRRAAMHEHMFVQPQFRDPGGATTSVVLFDVGPLQLGAPRLGQLATLLVLARRAEAAGAVFRFGVLQDAETRLWALDADAITRWQQARSWLHARTHVDAWTERLAELEAADRWLVGDTSATPIATVLHASTISIDEHETPQGHTLVVRTHRRDAVGDLATLELPPERDALRLLRFPFARAATPPPRITHETIPSQLGRLSHDGRRLLLARRDGGIDALHMPGSAREGQGATKLIRAEREHVLVAADMHLRRPISISARDGELVVAGTGLTPRVGHRLTERTEACSLGHRISTGIDVPPALLPRDGIVHAHLHVMQATPKWFHAWVVCDDGPLFELNLHLADDFREPRNFLNLVDEQCHGFTRLGDAPVAWFSGTTETIRSVPELHDLPTELHREACVFAAAPRGDITVAASTSVSDVMVFHVEPRIVRRMVDSTLIGLAWRTTSDARSLPVLLMSSNDECEVWSSEAGKRLFRAPSPMVRVRYEPACRRVLYRTRAGHRGVYSLDRDAVVWQAMPRIGGDV